MDRLTMDCISKNYGALNVIDGISISIPAGEFCVILGPSGSGKSTLIDMIGGFTPPSGGHILINGIDVAGLSPNQRNIGMMFQGYALFPHMTVFDNVSFPLRARGLPTVQVKEKVGRILDIVELGSLAERLPSQLSGGQRQRTALARALVFEPELLLMDEPLSALDRGLRERMQIEIKAVQRRLAITTLYITHDQSEAMALADRIVVLRNGRVEQSGRPLDVYRSPHSRFIAGFLGECNVIPLTIPHDGQHDQGLTRGGIPIRGTAHGEPGPAPQSFALVRPERVVLSRAPADAVNALPVTIRDVLELGPQRRFRATCSETDTDFLIVEQASSDVCGFAVGDQAIASFAEANTVFVPH